MIGGIYSEMGWVLSNKDIKEAKKGLMNIAMPEYVLLGTLLAIGMVIRKPSNGPSTSTMITAGETNIKTLLNENISLKVSFR